MSNNPYYEQDTQFVLGFAGSGKSTELANQANPKTLVLVPTHKAADVLKAKGIENVYTIHSVLKLVPTINENFKKKLNTKLKKVGETDLSEITDVFIDEFSMISQEILDILFDVLPDHAKVTIFGDPYQLPPVTGEAIQPWEPLQELTTQHRSKNPEGTELFMKFMRSIRDFTDYKMIDVVKDKDWVKKFNPDTDRVLCFTNKRMVYLNTLIGGDNPFYYNDELVMNGLPVTMVVADFKPRIYPACVEKGKLMSGTKLIKKADTVNRDLDKYNTNLGMYKQMVIEHNDDQYLIYYDPNHYATEQRLKTDVEIWQRNVIKENNLKQDDNIPAFCRANRNKPGVYERGKAWSKYLAHKNYVFNITRPYCTTVHKAQGSEFSTVFIDYDDLLICRNINPEQYKRLMYVALSRAIDKIILI